MSTSTATHDKPTTVRGICPGCGFAYVLKVNGTLRNHRRRFADGYYSGGRCSGTNQRPIDIAVDPR